MVRRSSRLSTRAAPPPAESDSDSDSDAPEAVSASAAREEAMSELRHEREAIAA